MKETNHNNPPVFLERNVQLRRYSQLLPENPQEPPRGPGWLLLLVVGLLLMAGALVWLCR